MPHRRSGFHARLLSGAAVISLLAAGGASAQEATSFNIPSQPLSSALNAFGEQSKMAVLFAPEVTNAKVSPGLVQTAQPEAALTQMLAGTGLTYRRRGDTFIVMQQGEGGSGPQGAGAGDVDALIVTAQKREENIQDVPIAMSAFSQEDLTTRQVAGGPDLITQVPNMTFTKTNFSSYSIQIRGIGTQAISATTDPAVAVAFNNTPFIRNRFFEQEFYDLQRVEVLRGPQGTLYGRNATAGVVNIISAKPKFVYEAKASGDVSNYKSSRIEGMVNIPLVEDAVALRLAGAWTKRDGYAQNEITGNPIDGRDLWSTRMSLRFAPTDGVNLNLIWEHFEEDDDRLRSGKQTCKKHVVNKVGPYEFGYTDGFMISNGEYYQSAFSQGCERNSLYARDSFQTPNGLAIPYYHPLSKIFLPRNRDIPHFDPYLSTVQSLDLRVIESTVDPVYRAKADLFEAQFDIDLSDSLSLSSETAYNADFIFSSQDYNRFNTTPNAWAYEMSPTAGYRRDDLLNAGVFCDPQIGCSDRLVGVDLSTAKSKQFSQELRLSSNFDGPLNFSLGANYLRYDTEDKYYVFINALSLFAAISPYARDTDLSPYVPGVTTNDECLVMGHVQPDPLIAHNVTACIYMDPNPIDSLNDRGHNYFLSKNPFKLISYAAFGEVYYQIAENLKITGGLRWTVDKKEAPISPSWILGSRTVGYPVAEVIDQEWREPTGRLTLDWKPDLDFTDETMVYASYGHGYKAGGANPPIPGVVIYSGLEGESDAKLRDSATHPRTFAPEFIDSFELGLKNVMLDGRLTTNFAAFYYDYEGYQISEIVNRSALNRNFDATIWGLELEADWRPLDNLRLGFKGGYQKTRLADGSRAIDLMDRTAGKEGWVLRRPFPTQPSNCILPTYVFVGSQRLATQGNPSGGIAGGCEIAYVLGHDPVTNLIYEPDPQVDNPRGGRLNEFTDYPGFNPLDESLGHNNGEGFFKDLSGNDLPNAPNYTATVTVDYTVPFGNDWLMTVHSDLHWQSESWWRVFNDHDYNRLKEYYTMNLAAIFTNEDAGWHVMAYVKNVTNETAITGAFLNSDDSMLTTNVFLTEPRLYGLRVTKNWSGGSLLGSFGERRDPSRPYPFTVELGGQVQRHTARNAALRPGFESAFPAFDLVGDAQNRDFDWGDGRSAAFTYRPGPGPWSVSASVRFGKTNVGRAEVRDEDPNEEKCAFAGASAGLCVTYSGSARDIVIGSSQPDWMEEWSSGREEHQFVDFAVRRDVNIGGLSRSTFGGGLKYAQFKADTAYAADGVLWDIQDGWFQKYPALRDRSQSTLEASREFEGAGPAVSWSAAYPLIGDDTTGRLELDWSLGAGMLFGKQKVSIEGEETAKHYVAAQFQMPFAQWSTPTSVSPPVHVDIERTKAVSVPAVDLSLGLSYTVDRMSIAAGYRWERYFDVIDGGFQAPEDADRTIDGPYFKIAIGFGG